MRDLSEARENALRRLRRDHRARLFLDVTPMLEEFWTGIPVVTANLARQFLAMDDSSISFFIGYQLVSRSHVEDALRRNTGLFLQRDCAQGVLFEGPLHQLPGHEISIGLFPSVKGPRRAFDIECSVVHDITTLTVPQFHTKENVRYHTSAIVEDLLSNDITFCISDTTLRDIEVYFGKSRFELIRTYNGVSWPDDFLLRALGEFDPLNTEPYFLVLATREPRKNISKIFDLLTIFPDVCEQYRFVIAGKLGWMWEDGEIPTAIRKAVDEGRIVFTGFVSEFEKYKLLLGAEASIYPSFLEGFGLPVLESLSVGTPCIASISSSMPEIGGDACIYFDPFSVTDLYRAIREVQTEAPKRNPEFRERCKKRASEFSWTQTSLTMLDAIERKLNDYANATGHLSPEA